MPKYYRVRTQEQWDWLMEWFEKDKAAWSLAECKPTQFNCPKRISEPVIRLNEDKSFDVFDINSVTMPDTIEVSDLMEENRMEDCVTIQGKNIEKLRTQAGNSIFYPKGESKYTYSFFEDYGISEVNIPKSLLYPKVRMSVAEKKEFDEMNKSVGLFDISETINPTDFLKWYERLFCSTDCNQAQLEFARAWVDPSLIDVIPDKKWNVKVPISHERDYYCKTASISGTTVVTFRVGNGSELWTDDDF